MTVPAFTRAESVSLLRSRRTELAAEPADRIAAGLGDLPLAVGPAAALLAETGLDAPSCALPAAGAGAAGRRSGRSTLDRLAADDPQAFGAAHPRGLVGHGAGAPDAADREPAAAARAAARRGADRSGLADHTALLRRRGLARVRRTTSAAPGAGRAAQRPHRRTTDDGAGRRSPSGCCGPPCRNVRPPSPRAGRPGGGCCRTCSRRPIRRGGSRSWPRRGLAARQRAATSRRAAGEGRPGAARRRPRVRRRRAAARERLSGPTTPRIMNGRGAGTGR